MRAQLHQRYLCASGYPWQSPHIWSNRTDSCSTTMTMAIGGSR